MLSMMIVIFIKEIIETTGKLCKWWALGQWADIIFAAEHLQL